MYRFPNADDDNDFQCGSEDFWNLEGAKKPLRENNVKGSGYKHVPHSEKSPQVVARRNARERRRVQAVNNAFVKLRNVVPIQNTRGKRISKVKTLLYAIDYIRALDQILQDCESYCDLATTNTYPLNLPENWHFEDTFHTNKC